MFNNENEIKVLIAWPFFSDIKRIIWLLNFPKHNEEKKLIWIGIQMFIRILQWQYVLFASTIKICEKHFYLRKPEIDKLTAIWYKVINVHSSPALIILFDYRYIISLPFQINCMGKPICLFLVQRVQTFVNWCLTYYLNTSLYNDEINIRSR